MTSKRILLRVMEEDDCPLFRTGDQMVVDLPGVDVTSSTQVCALTVAKLLGDHLDGRCQDLDWDNQLSEMMCPRKLKPVRFELEVLSPREEPSPVRGELGEDIAGAVAHLRSIPLFRALPAGFLHRLAGRIRVETYKDGELILQKGHPGKGFYIVRSGRLEVVAFAEHHVSSVVTKLEERDCFGEMSMLTATPVSASVVARGDVSVWVMEKEDFDSMLRENPFMAARFTRLMASRLLAANYLLVREGSKSFSGKLDVMSLVTVIQVLSDSRRSGTLEVHEKSGPTGRIGYSDGRIYSMVQGELTGEDALYAMLDWREGDFWLNPKMVPEEDEVKASVMNLLLEGMRRLDEASRTDA